jgi:predicted lysophospholipase L1 biosynthesis ABC-type transport system permease subunit
MTGDQRVIEAGRVGFRRELLQARLPTREARAVNRIRGGTAEFEFVEIPVDIDLKVSFLLRASGDPAAFGSAVRHGLAEVNSTLPILYMRTVNAQIDRRVVTERLIAKLAAFFGGLALLMAAIGLYGVMSYSISRRTSEIGIRMSLGASEGGVLWMVLHETIWLVAIGVVIGLPCAIGAGRLIANRLFGITSADPGTIGLAVAMLFGIAILAGYTPARRAARVAPIEALRND